MLRWLFQARVVSISRRRLLLERAAWQLLQSTSVTDAGLGAAYGSTEAFSRAFTRAYAVPPSRFALERPGFRLSAPNGIHFHPHGGLVAEAAQSVAPRVAMGRERR